MTQMKEFHSFANFSGQRQYKVEKKENINKELYMERSNKNGTRPSRKEIKRIW